MPMTAPSFSRTTRAPDGSDTSAAVTVAGAAVAARPGRRRRRRGAAPVRRSPCRRAGTSTTRASATATTPAIASAASTMTGALRPRDRDTTSVPRSRACAACVNVVGFAGCSRRLRAAVGAVRRAAGVGRPVSAACTIGHRLHAVGGLLLETPEDQPLQVLGNRRRRSSAAAAAAALMCRWTISPKPSRHERRAPAHHLVEDHAQRVDVGAVIDLARAAALLGRHVRGRAHHRAGPRPHRADVRIPAAPASRCRSRAPSPSPRMRRDRRARGRGCRA